MKKTKIVIVMALMLALLVTGCGTTPAPSATPTPAPATPPAPPQESTKTGVLIEASMHVISIQAPDGTTYIFGVDDSTDIQGSEVLGNTVEVTFEGEYKSDMIATSIVTISEHPEFSPEPSATPAPSASASPSASPTPAPEVIKYVTGTVLDASMSNIKFLDSFGNTYTVLKDDNTKVDSGIEVGCIARVFHKGSIKDGMVATEIKLITSAADAAKPSATPAPSAAPSATPAASVKYVTGLVLDASMNNITIEDKDGNDYTVLKDDSTKSDEDIATGCIVKVFHTGDLKSDAMATEIMLLASAPEEGEEFPALIGEVVDSANANITVKARDNEKYTFLKNDDTIVDGNGITDVGSKVKIIFSGQLLDKPVATVITAPSH